ncbi:MAG: hypothetical protein Q4F00_13915 [bacterium]|nr:hypothetical protein [bacterium]
MARNRAVSVNGTEAWPQSDPVKGFRRMLVNVGRLRHEPGYRIIMRRQSD